MFGFDTAIVQERASAGFGESREKERLRLNCMVIAQ